VEEEAKLALKISGIRVLCYPIDTLETIEKNSREMLTNSSLESQYDLVALHRGRERSPLNRCAGRWRNQGDILIDLKCRRAKRAAVAVFDATARGLEIRKVHTKDDGAEVGGLQ
jgi:hypothetical protein